MKYISTDRVLASLYEARLEVLAVVFRETMPYRALDSTNILEETAVSIFSMVEVLLSNWKQHILLGLCYLTTKLHDITCKKHVN
jgi:hypothetical protein